MRDEPIQAANVRLGETRREARARQARARRNSRSGPGRRDRWLGTRPETVREREEAAALVEAALRATRATPRRAKKSAAITGSAKAPTKQAVEKAKVRGRTAHKAAKELLDGPKGRARK